jgi:coenzyme F420-reducing hydrogenase delta subunit
MTANLKVINDLKFENRILKQRIRAIKRTLREFAANYEKLAHGVSLSRAEELTEEFVTKLREMGL